MNNVEKRIAAIEKNLLSKTGVGVLMKAGETWCLHFGGKSYNFDTEEGATEEFYRKMSPSAVLITWGR